MIDPPCHELYQWLNREAYHMLLLQVQLLRALYSQQSHMQKCFVHLR